MKIFLVSKCSLDIEQHVEFKMSVLISPSKSLISLCWVTYTVFVFLICSLIGLPSQVVYKYMYQSLRGYTFYPQKAPELVCFVLYLKIINIFLKNDICILYNVYIVQGIQKNIIKIKVGQAVLELLILNQRFNCFDL